MGDPSSADGAGKGVDDEFSALEVVSSEKMSQAGMKAAKVGAVSRTKAPRC